MVLTLLLLKTYLIGLLESMEKPFKKNQCCSPGVRGGSSVLEIAKNRFPFQGGIVKGSFSLPNFNDNFDAEKGITNEKMRNQLLEITKSVTF